MKMVSNMAVEIKIELGTENLEIINVMMEKMLSALSLEELKIIKSNIVTQTIMEVDIDNDEIKKTLG